MEAYKKGALLGEGTFGKVHQYTQITVSLVSLGPTTRLKVEMPRHPESFTSSETDSALDCRPDR